MKEEFPMHKIIEDVIKEKINMFGFITVKNIIKEH